MDQDPPAGRTTRRAYILLAIGVAAVILAVTGAVAVIRSHRHHQAETRPAPPAATSLAVSEPASWAPSTPALPADVTTGWAYIDSTEGDMIVGGDGQQHTLDQLVIPGIAADYLDQHPNSLSPHDLVVIENALAGDPAASRQLVDQAGGVEQVWPRVIDNCQLTTTVAGPPAAATVLDMAHYGACLREGALVDPDRSAWVLDQMRQPTGGIGDVRGNDGGQRLAQFNSTVVGENGRNRTTCLGIGAYWSAAVVVNWPADRGAPYGLAACAQVARDQFPPDTQKAPDSPAPSDLSPATTCPYGTCRATD
jgi:hypothetical protein